MFDLAFAQRDDGTFDLVLDDNHLREGNVLESAVILSLFLDARAGEGDELPYGVGSRRGYWADSLEGIEGDRSGSKLWLLSREKQTSRTLSRARDYARQALAWLVEDGVAARVEVAASWAPGRADAPTLFLEIDITDRAGDQVSLQYRYAWAERVTTNGGERAV